MLKAFGRAIFITIVLFMMGAAIWFHPVISIIVLFIAWLTFMLFVDPPENWD